MAALIRSTRSWTLKSPDCLFGLPVTRMAASSKRAAARWTMASWPKVIGSKEPVQTSLVMSIPFTHGHVDTGDAVGVLLSFVASVGTFLGVVALGTIHPPVYDHYGTIR